MVNDSKPSLVQTDGTEIIKKDQKTQKGQQSCFQIPESLSYIKMWNFVKGALSQEHSQDFLSL